MSNIISSDIYDIASMVNKIQKRYMEDISDDTLTMGMYGYMNEIFTNAIQNSIIMSSEWGNEAFPIRAKFEKSIITNAITYGIEDINAIPPRMEIMVGFIEKELNAKMENNKFILDRLCPIYIGEFEFHLDYDIIIDKSKLNNEYIYSARYDITNNNPLSDIVSPYLAPPIRININSEKYIFINCIIRQVEISKVYSKIISNNILDNKTLDFEIQSQLASFKVIINENNKTTELTPIFEGMPTKSLSNYCFYTFLDSNNIRIKFDRNSYEPKLNANITIDINTTQGSKAIFNYKEDIIVGLKSDIYRYGNLFCLIKPVTGSEYGIDKKSIKELKEIIPKEILSRGNITNNKDIQNYFDTMDSNKLFFYRRRDNQFERLYYAYMLVKDADDNVVPTNTINLKLYESDFDYIRNGRYILNPDNVIEYKGNDICVVNNSINKNSAYSLEEERFLYMCPYLFSINKNPLASSYYLNTFNNNYFFKFTYINNNSVIQFISTSMNFSKVYDNNKYIAKMTIMQNMSTDVKLVELDTETGEIVSKIKPVLILTNDNNYKYYVYGNIVEITDDFTYEVEFELETDNIIDKNNKIKLDNIFMGGTSNRSYVYLPEQVGATVAIYAMFDEDFGRDNMDSIIPSLDGYTLCNKYETSIKLNLYYNYSHIIRSNVKVIQDEDENGHYFKVIGVPVVRYSYLKDDLTRCLNFIDYVQYRKAYIDNALDVLENSFGIDFKFFNTYGVSKMFKIGHNKEPLDKVNITFNFKVKLKQSASNYAKELITEEIKTYIENINVIESIHMSNLVTYLTNTFKTDIEFIEFLGMNNYNALYQYIEKVETNIIEDVPEFLNVNLKNDLNPDINIILV